MIEIPLDSTEANFIQDVVLGETEYKLKFLYNVRCKFWTCSIYTIDNQPIVENSRLSINYPLFARYSDPRLPKGFLYVIDITGSNVDPDFESLGSRVILVYDDGTP